MRGVHLLRHKLLALQGGRCFYCQVGLLPAGVDDDRSVTLEQRVPRSRGGKSAHNLVAACRQCNQDKGNMTEIEFRAARRETATQEVQP